jgi:hypothetical protein
MGDHEKKNHHTKKNAGGICQDGQGPVTGIQ